MGENGVENFDHPAVLEYVGDIEELPFQHWLQEILKSFGHDQVSVKDLDAIVEK